MPYPIIWPDKINRSKQYVKDVGRFYYFSGIVKAIAVSMNIEIRWGGDWDNDNDFNDQTFDDLCHYELYFRN